jgi:cytoskeleton protein RodZ
VFEIGNSLREARMRRGIDFAQAETTTKIRGKYLRALEDEQFELLPAQTYVRGFLRTYAEFLGLDGQLYVDEFNSRFVSGEEHEPRVRRSQARRPRRDRRSERNIVIGALVVIAVLTVIVISAWASSSGGNQNAGKHTASTPKNLKPRVVPPLLSLKAVHGTTHAAVRVASATGDIKFEGTIQAGEPAVSIRGRRLWVQIDTPEVLRIEVRGKLVHVPGSKPRVIIVTPTGWRPA